MKSSITAGLWTAVNLSPYLADVLEVVPDHGRDGDGVPGPDPGRARGVVLVHRADLELALLEEEDLRVLVPVEDRGTAARRDGNLQDEQLAGGVPARGLDRGYVCDGEPVLAFAGTADVYGIHRMLLPFASTVLAITVSPDARGVYDENLSCWQKMVHLSDAPAGESR
jgi:hypothetical protein